MIGPFIIRYGTGGGARIAVDVPTWARCIARRCYRYERRMGARRHQAKAEVAFYLLWHREGELT